jgi:hypothetical protein
LSIESDEAKRKYDIMNKLASMHEDYRAWMSKSASPSTKDERLRFELRKLAGSSVSDGVLSQLRAYDPADAFRALGDAGIVMDVPSFFKYAFGPDYGKVEKYVGLVQEKVAEVIDNAVKTASCSKFCNDSRYDASKVGSIGSKKVASSTMLGLVKSSAARGFGTDDAVTSIMSVIATGSEPVFAAIDKEASAIVDGNAADGVESKASTKLAEKYTMYKLAGIDAVLNGACGASLREDDVIAVAAAQDLKRTKVA